jgi:predicted Zn finger-like uncharacterized protein
MRIVCPSCEATYEVPLSVLSRRRALRCARCHTEWSPAVERREPVLRIEPATALEPPAIEPPEPAPPVQAEPPFNIFTASPASLEEDSLPPPRTRAAPVIAAWVVSFAVLGALGWGLVTRRDAVMRVWPPSTRVYAALGYL